MNTKTLHILGAVLIALVIIAIAPLILAFIPLSQSNDTQKLLGISASALTGVTSFTISQPKTDPLAFTKNDKNAGWQINNTYDADTASVQALLQTLGEARINNVASRNLAHTADFGLDDASAINLSLTLRSAAKLNLAFGKSGALYSSVYVLKQGDSVIYLLDNTNARTYLTYALTDWRAKGKK